MIIFCPDCNWSPI